MLCRRFGRRELKRYAIWLKSCASSPTVWTIRRNPRERRNEALLYPAARVGGHAPCRMRTQTAANQVPEPPSIAEPQVEAAKSAVPEENADVPPESEPASAPMIPAVIDTQKPLYTELGLASWYGP